MWFGKPGSLVELPDPQAPNAEVNIALASTRETGLQTSMAGGATVAHSYIQPLRSWELPFDLMGEDDISLIQAYYSGQNGLGPWAMLLGIRTNYLSPNQASATDQFGDTTGFAATAGTLSSTALYAVQGQKSLLWATPATPVANSYISLSWHGSSYGYPCVPGEYLTFSGQLSGSTASQVVRPALAFFDNTGASVSTALGPLSNTTAALDSYQTTFITSLVPGTAVYVQPRLIVTSPVASASITVDALQLERTTAHSLWKPGEGTPLVSIMNFPLVANYNPYYTIDRVTFQEVGNARR